MGKKKNREYGSMLFLKPHKVCGYVENSSLHFEFTHITTDPTTNYYNQKVMIENFKYSKKGGDY